MRTIYCLSAVVPAFAALQSSYQQRTYCLALSVKLAYMSKIAYEPKNLLEDWSCVPCKKAKIMKQTEVFYSEAKNVQAFAGYDQSDQAIVVAFRGTQRGSVQNYLSDLNALKKSWTHNKDECVGCIVHKGFEQGLLEVKQSLQKKVKDLTDKYPGCKIYVTGHSLGGAMAALFATSITSLLKNEVILYTYGQPRVGNDKLNKFIQSRIPTYYRVVHDDDVVARLPFKWMGYSHAGKTVLYNDDLKTYRMCPANSKCSDKYFLQLDFIKDHTSDDYVQMEKDYISKNFGAEVDTGCQKTSKLQNMLEKKQQEQVQGQGQNSKQPTPTK